MDSNPPAGATSALPAINLLPAPRRRIVLFGNCQIQAMIDLYRRYVAGRSGDILTYVASYADMKPEDQTAVDQADLIVEQLFDMQQKSELGDAAAAKPRLHMPMVAANFLWPFLGQPHPHSRDYPFYRNGPYLGQASDDFLNRHVLRGTDPEQAVEEYMQLDIGARKLDRLYELIVERQRVRDQAAGFETASIVEKYFRTEQVFLSPNHPNTRLAVEMAAQFFERLGATRAEIDRMRAGVRVTPFPRGELPIHHSVISHFRLEWITPDYRYQFLNEGRYSFREWALRYMRYEWNARLEEGLHHAHHGRVDEALPALIEGLGVNPGSARGFSSLAFVLNRLGRPEDAIGAYRRAVALDPSDGSSHLGLGVALGQHGDQAEAEGELREAVALDPANTHYLTCLSHFLRARGRHAEAIEMSARAIEQDPWSAQLRVELSVAREAGGDIDGAIADQRSAIEMQPDTQSYRERLVNLLLRAKHQDAAIEAARLNVDMHPEEPRHRIQLSEALQNAGRCMEAMHEAMLVTVLSPLDATGFAHLGMIFHRNNHPAAGAAMNRAIELAPNDANLLLECARYLETNNRLGEAVEMARKAFELNRADRGRAHRLKTLLSVAGDQEGIAALSRQVAEIYPADSQVRVDLSDALARLGRDNEALNAVRVAVELAPDNTRALHHMGFVLTRLGRMEEAEQYFLRAHELNPANPHHLHWLNTVRRDLGKPKAA